MSDTCLSLQVPFKPLRVQGWGVYGASISLSAKVRIAGSGGRSGGIRAVRAFYRRIVLPLCCTERASLQPLEFGCRNGLLEGLTGCYFVDVHRFRGKLIIGRSVGRSDGRTGGRSVGSLHTQDARRARQRPQLPQLLLAHVTSVSCHSI